jgi:hypothetical protein
LSTVRFNVGEVALRPCPSATLTATVWVPACREVVFHRNAYGAAAMAWAVATPSTTSRAVTVGVPSRTFALIDVTPRANVQFCGDAIVTDGGATPIVKSVGSELA